MKVLLLKDVRNVGRRHDVKDVSDGFAMNSLLPRGLAVAATGSVLKRAEAEKAKEEAARNVRDAQLAEHLGKAAGKKVAIRAKANEQGHLFASIHAEELAIELGKAVGVEIDAESIKLDKPIKETGEHDVILSVGGKETTFKVEVTAQE